MIPAIFATLLFCISAVAANRAIKLLGSIEANFWRLLFASFLLAGWAHKWGSGTDGNAFIIFFLSGIIGFGIGDLALYFAYPRIGSRLTLLIVHCSAAPLASFCEWLYLDTSLTTKEMIASSTILIGIATSLVPSKDPHLKKKQLISGCLFGILAAAGQGIGAVMSRVGYEINEAYEVHEVHNEIHQETNFDGMTIAYQRILGGLLVSFTSFIWVQFIQFHKRSSSSNSSSSNSQRSESSEHLFQKNFHRNILPPLPAIWWILATGLAGPTFGVACYQWALEGTKSGVVLPIVATAPLIVMPLSVWMEGDKPSPRAIFGGVIAVSGVMIFAL